MKSASQQPLTRVLEGYSQSLGLTPREVEVLFWISEGKSNHEIAIILGACTGTIRKHVEHILSKLNVESRTAAAVMALRRRLAVSF
jgi:DNA-binding NarL/FixJ family response regulator